MAQQITMIYHLRFTLIDNVAFGAPQTQIVTCCSDLCLCVPVLEECALRPSAVQLAQLRDCIIHMLAHAQIQVEAVLDGYERYMVEYDITVRTPPSHHIKQYLADLLRHWIVRANYVIVYDVR